MRFSAQLTMIMGLVFAAVCLGFAVTGFVSLREITDPAQASDAQGFAWFWAFLAAVALFFSGVSWWIARTERDE